MQSLPIFNFGKSKHSSIDYYYSLYKVMLIHFAQLFSIGQTSIHYQTTVKSSQSSSLLMVSSLMRKDFTIDSYSIPYIQLNLAQPDALA